MSAIPLTVSGVERLQKELHRLKSVERPEIINAIAEARAQGDLSENAEYDAARERLDRRHRLQPGRGRPRRAEAAARAGGRALPVDRADARAGGSALGVP